MALTLLVSACSSGGGGSSNSADGSTITIGAILPMSGAYGVVGQAVAAGLRVGIAQVNGAGGVLDGHKLALSLKDDGSDPTKDAAAATELFNSGKIQIAALSPISDGVLAALPVTTRQKVVTFTQTGLATVADPKKYPYSFMYSVPYSNQADPTVYTAKAQGAHKVGILTGSDPTGKSVGSTMKDSLSKFGLTLADYEEFDPTSQDLSPQVAKIRAAGADTILVQAPAAQLGVAMKAVQQLGGNLRVVATNGSVTGDLNQLVPSAIVPSFSAVVPRVVSRTDPNALDSQYADYVKQLSAYLSDVPSLTASVFATDVLNVMAAAIKQAGSTDPAKVRSALESLAPSNLAHPLYVFPSPAYSADTHTPTKADFSKSWSVVKVSKPLDGTYVGTPLKMP